MQITQTQEAVTCNTYIVSVSSETVF